MPSNPELHGKSRHKGSVTWIERKTESFCIRLPANESISGHWALAGYEVQDNGDWSVGRPQERRQERRGAG